MYVYIYIYPYKESTFSDGRQEPPCNLMPAMRSKGMGRSLLVLSLMATGETSLSPVDWY